MESGKIEQKNIAKKGASRVATALGAATAAGVIAGGAVGAVSQDSTEASAGDSSWGARTEEFQQIDPTPIPDQVTEITPTPSPTPTIGEPSWSATPSVETPTATPSEPSPTPKWVASSVLVAPSPETPASLPQTGGEPAKENQAGTKNKLFLALSAVLSGIIGIGAASKASNPRSSQK